VGDVPLLEHADGELVERLELMRPVNDRLVDLHPFDRDRRLGCEERHDLFVSLCEDTAVLSREVEIPVHDVAHEDRDAEEAPHRRMAGRKAPEMWVLCHVGKAERAPITQQDAENAVVTGRVSDLGSRFLVDPRRDEALQV
jgi:hypothetical protein